jgi:hypothetical protein
MNGSGVPRLKASRKTQRHETMEAATTIADLTIRIFLYIMVQVNGREDSK